MKIIYKGKEQHQTLISSNDNRFPFNFFSWSKNKNKIIKKNLDVARKNIVGVDEDLQSSGKLAKLSYLSTNKCGYISIICLLDIMWV